MVRLIVVYLVVVMSALVAPASRKSGTTQFVLTVPVSRIKLAICQFSAMALFVSGALIGLHLLYSYWAYRIGAIEVNEIMLSWIFLILPALATAAILFALSLTGSLGNVIVLLVIASMLLGILESWTAELSPYVPNFIFRARDNLALLFPSTRQMITWPHLPSSISTERGFMIDWGWLWLHECFVTIFWVTLGSWTYLNRQYGSRLPQK